MPREDASLLIRPWAAGGDTRRPEQDSLDRNIGWPVSYSQVGGDLPARETFNQLFLEMSTMLHEINLHGGILEWNSGIAYSHPAVVMAGDVPWISVRDSTGTDPETPGQTDWRMLIPESVQAASQSIAGIIALATQDETNAGSVSTRAVTPATLHNRTATTSRRGIVELATSAETAGTDSSRAVTPAGLSARTSSTTRSGIVELATAAETAAGQDNSRAVTPFSMANLIPGPATQTEQGIIELATQAEVDLGTDGVRAVTPATLDAILMTKADFDIIFNGTRDGSTITFTMPDGLEVASYVFFIGEISGTISTSPDRHVIGFSESSIDSTFVHEVFGDRHIHISRPTPTTLRIQNDGVGPNRITFLAGMRGRDRT